MNHHALLPATLLASRELTDSDRTTLLIWGMATIGVLVLGGVMLMYLRRHTLEKKQDPMEQSPLGFSLADLRQMRNQKQISEAEFQIAKDKLISKLKPESAQRPTPPTHPDDSTPD